MATQPAADSFSRRPLVHDNGEEAPTGVEDLKQRDPTQWALRERVKELTCLYGIAQIADRLDFPTEEVGLRIAALLPPAWQYPDVTSARVTIDEREFCSQGFREGPHRQSAPVLVRGRPRGIVEVFYLDHRPAADEDAFLAEERSLINEVARQVGLALERRLAEAEKTRLQEQLRHADRLATVGQLAAGIAHELNEPLGVILGYAQLQLKSFGLPDQTGRDLERIVKASLHAREIVRKLLLFAREVISEKKSARLNQVVREGIYLLESRCARAHVKLVLRLAKDLPEVFVDAGQLHQVILNLGINAVQSMPGGGQLTVSTAPAPDGALLAVEDTGVGIPREVLSQIFDPFFTTKDVGQGTGLGLSVVHGIVTAHGGVIRAESTVGKGSLFEIYLPAGAGQKQDG
jgi:signal transduction histidine kinase